MGKKANKFLAVAGIVVVVATGIGQVAGGFNLLFGPASLPECESTDASSLVRKIIADNYGVELEKLAEVKAGTFDEQGQKRSCTALIDSPGEGVFEIAYDLAWHNRDEKMIAAEVMIVGPKQ